jgi:hypothetical protein
LATKVLAEDEPPRTDEFDNDGPPSQQQLDAWAEEAEALEGLE